jgi:cation transport ATPase
MTCAACAARIETVLNKLPGVADGQFRQRKASIRYVPGQAERRLFRRAPCRLRCARISLRHRAAEKARKAAAYRPTGASGFPSRAACRCWRRWGRCSRRARGHAAALAAVPAGHAGAVLDRRRFYVGAWSPCAAAAPTWTCWWPSAPAWPTSSVCGGDRARSPPPACVFRGLGQHHHPGADGQAAGSARPGQAPRRPSRR